MAQPNQNNQGFFANQQPNLQPAAEVNGTKVDANNNTVHVDAKVTANVDPTLHQDTKQDAKQDAKSEGGGKHITKQVSFCTML